MWAGRVRLGFRLKDEPGAVSGSKWPQAETHQHAAGREPSLPFPAVEPKVFTLRTPPIKFFRSGIQKAQKIPEGCTCQAGGYQMIMLIHLENRSNHSANTDTEYRHFFRSHQMMTITPTLCPQTIKSMWVSRPYCPRSSHLLATTVER